MASKREMVKLRSTESNHTRTSEKNRSKTPDRLELKKFDPVLRKHVVYKETK